MVTDVKEVQTLEIKAQELARSFTREAIEAELKRCEAAMVSFRSQAEVVRYWQARRRVLELALFRKRYMTEAELNYRLDALQIKASIRLEDIIGKYTTLRRSGNRLNGLCPLHHDTHPSLFVYVERQDFYCYGCGRGGDVFNFVMHYCDCSFYEALVRLSRGDV